VSIQLTEKYRPKNLEECVLPKRIREPLEKLIKTGSLGHLCFYGKAGIGKTATAEAIIKELKTENTYIVNASQDNSALFIETRLINFFYTSSLLSGRKIVLLDEADNLTDNAQKMLKVPLEKTSHLVDVIFCCNDFNKINDAIKSRCLCFNFNLSPKEDDEVKDSILNRLLDIVKKEKLGLNKKQIEEIYIDCNSDMRKMIRVLSIT
jgi:DNA polymerase III delta prime subunit